MSQDDIIKILEKKKEPLTSRELSEYLNITQKTIIRTLKKLLKYKEIESRKMTPEDIKNKQDIINMTHKNSRWRVFFVKSCG